MKSYIQVRVDGNNASAARSCGGKASATTENSVDFHGLPSAATSSRYFPTGSGRGSENQSRPFVAWSLGALFINTEFGGAAAPTSTAIQVPTIDLCISPLAKRNTAVTSCAEAGMVEVGNTGE